MRGPERLIEAEGRWVTDMGGCFPGERVVFRGRDLFHDLKDLPWMGLLLYGITGRLFSDKQIKLFEGIWRISSSYPEPRIWNNRIAALAGTVRSTGNLGISAAIAVSEATIYGQRPLVWAMHFLLRTRRQIEEGGDLADIIRDELKNHRSISGFGRPVVRGDERIGPLMALAKDLGYSDGTYVKLAFEVEKELLNGRWRLRMNVAALDAALASDQGLSVDEFKHYMILCFTGGLLPCYLNTSKKEHGTFFPMRCNRIRYDGMPYRKWDDREQTPSRASGDAETLGF